MNTLELEEGLMKLIDSAILEANKGEKMCGCGQTILDRDKTKAVFEEIMALVVGRLAAFWIVASDSGVNLHLPKSSNRNLH